MRYLTDYQLQKIAAAERLFTKQMLEKLLELKDISPEMRASILKDLGRSNVKASMPTPTRAPAKIY